MTDTPPSADFSIQARSRPGSGLHIVATPIGHLDDITLRALATLKGVDLIACEDTRVTGKLLAHYGIKTPLISYHDHNARDMRPKLLERLAAGARIAIVSDAGTPLVSDPGFKLVEAVRAAGHAVVPIPGPSALLAALVASGLPTDSFFFAGFLPVKTVARCKRAAELGAVPGTLVFFETGPRLAAALADLAATLGDRPAAIARELTKLHEEVVNGSLETLAARYADLPPPKGEIVLVVGPPLSAEEPAEEEVDALLAEALASASLKDAVDAITAKTGLPRRDVYQRALALRDGNDTLREDER